MVVRGITELFCRGHRVRNGCERLWVILITGVAEVSVFACVCVQVCVYLCTGMCVFVYRCVRVCMCVSVTVCDCVCMCVFVRMSVSLCTLRLCDLVREIHRLI